MPTTNARKHIIPLGTEASFTRATLFKQFGQSISDVVPVANVDDRAQVVADLTAAGRGPTSARPLVVIRADARGLHRIEYTYDGTVWLPGSGVLDFSTKAAADSFGTANAGLLTVGDHATIGGLDYVWTGTAWAARQSAWTVVPAYDATWSVAGAYGYRSLSVKRSGELVKLEGAIARTTGTIADGYVGANVPEGFRPSSRVWVPSGFSPLTASARNVEVVVETDGAVKFGLFGQPDIPTNQVINLSGMWFA